MLNQFSRMQLLVGEEAMEKLFSSRVAIFGIGGVGGYTVEALARSGVGTLDLVDSDRISLTNLNRQIIALWSTVGKYKVDVMRDRILDINPSAQVNVHRCFYLPETKDEFDFSEYDYVVDAVDTVTAKIQLVMQAEKAGIPIISSMGAGNKLDPAAFKVADIYKTSVCPLAKVMRRELKKCGIKKLKVVYSEEPPQKPLTQSGGGEGKTDVDFADEVELKGASGRVAPGSAAFVPSAAGLILAGEVIKDLMKRK